MTSQHLYRETKIIIPDLSRLLLVLSIAAVIFLVMGSFPCYAKDTHSSQVQTATNVDGSAFRLITKSLTKQGLRVTKVMYRQKKGGPMQAIGKIVQLVDENTRSMVFAIDWDKDGMHEIQTVGECDFGPNCSGMIYRIDPRLKKVVEFFKTSGSDVSLIHGHLIEKFRDRCCAWIADAHKLKLGRTEVESVPAFSVLIEYVDDKSRRRPVDCTFYNESSGGRLLIKPPASAFLKICDHYDGAKYFLKSPR